MNRIGYSMIFLFSFVSGLVCADSPPVPTLSNGLLQIPYIQVGEMYFSMDLIHDNDQDIADTFSMNKLFFVKEGSSLKNADYYPERGSIEIRHLQSGGKQYHVTLMQLEDGRFKVSSLTPADAMSLLYLLTAGTVDFSSGASYGDRVVGNHFIISSDELAINEFSDRPYRFAQAYGGDANDFAAFYQGSNFETDNPNATIVGTNPGTGDIFYSIFEIGDLFSYDDKVIVTIRSLLGSSELPDSSFLTNASIVIDNFFTDLGKAIVSGTCIGTVESILTVEGFDAMLAESALTGCDAAGETFIAMCSAAMAESVVGVGACAAGGGTFIKLCNDSDVPYYEKKEKMAESMCP